VRGTRSAAAFVLASGVNFSVCCLHLHEKLSAAGGIGSTSFLERRSVQSARRTLEQIAVCRANSTDVHAPKLRIMRRNYSARVSRLLRALKIFVFGFCPRYILNFVKLCATALMI
jgi:hypothetical protein